MKIFLHKTALVGLMVLYAFLVSFHIGDGLSPNSSLTTENSQSGTESYQSVTGKSLITHTSLTENVLSVITVGKAPSFKYRFSDTTSCIRYGNRVISNQLLQHEYFYKDTHIGLLQTDIIFPFHYFW